MAWSRGGFTPPSRHDHRYQMHYSDEQCWCRGCGQTWKWLGPDKKGWFPLPLTEVKNGERIYPGDPW